MRSRSILLTGILIGVAIAVLLLLTLFLTPAATPAFDTAVNFVNAAAQGEDILALPLLSSDLQQYVADQCPEGSVSACVKGYTPPEWGGMIDAVFRRAIPSGNDAWDVLLVATYQKGQGFSGVCIYNRVERLSIAADRADEQWRVTRWSGFTSCDEPNAGLSELRDRPDAPNRAP